MWQIVIVLSCSSYFVSCGRFTIHVESNKLPINTSSTAKRGEIDYHGIYHFFDGEHVKFTCFIDYMDTETRLSYIISLSSNAYGANITTAPKPFSANDKDYFFLTLTAENSGNYIQCRVDNGDGKQMSVTRIYLELSNRMPDFGFRVNGVPVAETKTKCPANYENHHLCFTYKYYIGENLTVESFKNKYLYGNLDCELPDLKLPTGSSITFSKVFNKRHISVNLECRVNMTTVTGVKINVVLTFFNPIIKSRSFIRGYSMAKNLGKADKTELYKYTNDEELHLSCVALNHYPQWKFDEKIEKIMEENSTYYRISNTTTEYVTTATIRLKKSEETAVISCFTGERQSSDDTKFMIIRSKHKLLETTPVPVKSTEIVTEPSSTEVTSIHATNLSPPSLSPSSSSSVKTLIGGSVGALVIIIVVGSIFIIMIKRKQKTPIEDSNFNYENLPEHNNGAMPVPRQWQEAQYAAPADRIANNDYAVPYKPTLEEMYAKPVAKIERSKLGNDNLIYASTDDLNETNENAVTSSNTTNKDNQIMRSGKQIRTYACMDALNKKIERCNH